MHLNEDTVEQAALQWLGEIGYAVVPGDAIAPGARDAERESWADVVLVDRLRAAIERLNPGLPEEAREDALRKLLRPDLPSLIQNNRIFHRRLRDGVEIEYRRDDGAIAGDHVLIFAAGDSLNDFLAVSQFTVVEGGHKHRLGDLIDLIGTIGLGDSDNRSKDILGRVYEYFLSRFASAEGKKGGQFYTPGCVVRVLVEMLAPFKGRVYDPCCGSGGMFVQAAKFIEAHANGNGNGGRAKGDIAVYGQESNATTRRLASMNLAIRGIDGDLGSEHADATGWRKSAVEGRYVITSQVRREDWEIIVEPDETVQLLIVITAYRRETP